ncbi:MAG TPA: DUF4375 domain-containing protein [Nocardioides sp.]|nr:DUF4375 domain-containing protein [uncultured Nocardioides sp.]HRD59640.1 DUF4375 domain-containing protein [Nocardioides sp.]HRI94389.1 DUF4375 domain-containing protein [Nocardioides sp.]
MESFTGPALRGRAGRPEAGRLAAERLAARDRELVVLWRAEADIYNGGFMQFLCNWGEPNCRAAIAAYDALGASESARLARAMFAVVEHYGQSVEVVSLAGLPAILTDDEHEQLQTLDECCWTDPDGLARLVVEHYDTPYLTSVVRTPRSVIDAFSAGGTQALVVAARAKKTLATLLWVNGVRMAEIEAFVMQHYFDRNASGPIGAVVNRTRDVVETIMEIAVVLHPTAVLNQECSDLALDWS